MSPEDLKDWKRDPRTQWVIAHLVAKRMQLQDIATDPDIINRGNMALVVAQVSGYVRAVEDILTVEVEDEGTRSQNSDQAEGS